MAREKFLTIKLSICRMTDLTPAEKLVLARIAGFKEYYESAQKCAELLGYTPGTVRKIKQTLEKKGYIRAIENHGRGKKYVAREDFKTNKASKPAVEKPVIEPTPVNTSMLKPSTPMKKDNTWAKETAREWAKRNKDLVPVLDACLNYLRRQQILVSSPAKLRYDIEKTAEFFRHPQDPTAHVAVLLSYIEYLESKEYLYQIEHNRYCPVVRSQNDLFAKFTSIRDFKWDVSKHYDPSRVLTRD